MRAHTFLQRCLLAAILALAVGGPNRFAAAIAQETREGTAEPDNGQVLPPAYDPQMMRLAEILGSLHYLRDLCGAEEGQRWREQMETLLEAEEPTPQRRAELIARFNRGFRGYREIYRECTPAAAEAANRYLRQGIRLAAEIPGRYGQ
ncbi:MAG: TIGR02301 family protein [Pseudomonadota bacterium]|nr:TIGR02301 family protein [Pseudomonadota bacterium]